MDSNGTPFFEERPIFVLDQQSLDIIDVNSAAVDLYGYSRQEFCSMNLKDLGEKKNRLDILDESRNVTASGDTLWIQENKKGEKLYIQFTSHVFNHQGRPAKLAVAHNVSEQISRNEIKRIRYPKFTAPGFNYPMAEINWDADFRIEHWSPRAEDLFGWSADEVVGQEQFFQQFIPDSEITVARKKASEAIENQEKYYTTEGNIITKEGNMLVCKWYNSLVYDEDDTLVSIRSLVMDLSEQRESQKLFRTLSEKSLVGVFLVQDGTFKHVNPRFAEIFGYEQQEIIDNFSPTELVHPQDRSLIKANIRDRLNGNPESEEYEVKGVTSGGRIIDVSLYESKIMYQGKPAIVGTVLDITKNKEAMRKYRASVETFQDLFDSISDAIYIQDSQGRFLEVNKGAEEMYGYDKEFMIGKTPEVLAAPGKVDLIETQTLTQKALQGEPQSFSWWGKRKNGEVFPKEMIMNPGSYFGEDVVITIARDISERYEAEEEMRKNEEMFRQLFQNAPIPITLMDKRQEIIKVNNSFQDTFGYQTDEVQGLDIDQLIVPEDEQEEAKKISDKIFSGQTAFHTGQRLTKDGSVVDVLIYGVPVIVDGKTIAIFGIYVDITDRKQAEEKVKKSLKEKEVLLAEIHHRVKNNLAVITGLLELQAFNTDSADATNVLKASQMRVNSIALIHEKLYQNENLSEISFDTYLKQLTDVIVSSMHSKATDVSINIDAEPIELTISQAIPCGLILNELITNAHKHAFDDQQEGKINIQIRNEDGIIELAVQDNGQGISEDVSLENPTSLGLKLIRTLSKQLEGKSEFFRNDLGTKFTLQFELEE